MKKIILTSLLIAAFFGMSEASAQIINQPKIATGKINDHEPHQQVLPNLQKPTNTLDGNNQSTHQQGSYTSRSNSATNGSTNNTDTSNNSSRSGSSTSTRNGNTNRNCRNNAHR